MSPWSILLTCRVSCYNNTRNTLNCDQSNYSLRIVFSHIPIEFGPTRKFKIPHSTDPKTILCNHLGCGQNGNNAIRSADPENPTLEPNVKWIGWHVVEKSPFKIRRSVGRQLIYLHWCQTYVACILSPNLTTLYCLYLRTCLHIYSGGTEVTVTGTNLDSVAEPSINLIVNITRISNRTGSSIISRSEVLW